MVLNDHVPPCASSDSYREKRDFALSETNKTRLHCYTNSEDWLVSRLRKADEKQRGQTDEDSSLRTTHERLVRFKIMIDDRTWRQ